MHIDYLIVGQGISGSLLSYYLLQAGANVLVIDECDPASASRVASGVINPVTGRRVVTTWMIDELLPFAINAYDEIGRELGREIAAETSMINFHTSEQMQSSWYNRIAEGSEYISNINDVDAYSKHFHVSYGAGLTFPCLQVDLNLLLQGWRQRLIDKGCLLEECFDVDKIQISNGGIVYNDVTAEKLIFCNGVNGFDNNYFRKLPFTLNKGEALIIEIEGLPPSAIYKHGISLVPIGDNRFWAGSSFDWAYDHPHPTDAFRADVENALRRWLKLPYKVLEHKAAIRPGSVERRPFVGLHPAFPSIGIMNGMGTKGCSLAPYFAHEFAGLLTSGKKINPEADIARFSKLLRS
ncbi:MAG TPA: FAD-binding oxidoreductase [Flavipsychrobacter sp.]